MLLWTLSIAEKPHIWVIKAHQLAACAARVSHALSCHPLAQGIKIRVDHLMYTAPALESHTLFWFISFRAHTATFHLQTIHWWTSYWDRNEKQKKWSDIYPTWSAVWKKSLKANLGTFGMLSYMKTNCAGMVLIAWPSNFIYLFVWVPYALIWSPPNLERSHFILGSTFITPGFGTQMWLGQGSETVMSWSSATNCLLKLMSLMALLLFFTRLKEL